MEARAATAEFGRLRLQVQAVERELKAMLLSEPLRAETWVGRQRRKTEQALREEARAVREQLKRIKGSNAAFKGLLGEMVPGAATVSKVQAQLESIEGSIAAFKERQRGAFAKLLEQEEVLQRELSAAMRRFEGWTAREAAARAAKAEGAAEGRQGPVRRAATTGHALPEAVALDRFLKQSGGLRGGWSEYEHGTFLKHWHRHRQQQQAVVTATAEVLVNKSVADVVQHFLWHQQHQGLIEDKRRAIEAWRETKAATAASEKAREAAAEAEAAAKDKARKGQIEAARRKAAEAKAEQARLWREATAAKAAEAAERAEAIEARRKAERREREQAAHQAKKEKVEAYARKRAAEQDRLRAAAEAAQRAAAPKPTAEELAWFRARDQEAFERTVARREQAQREEEDKLKRLKKLRSQVKVNVRRDPSRLTRPTASSAARKQDTSTSGGQMHVRAPPRLATPAWRKGM